MTRLKKEDIKSLYKDKGLKQHQIAKLSGYSEGRISQILQEFKTNPEFLHFKDKKAEILEGLQAHIVNSIEDEDIKKANLQQKIWSTGVLQDKIQALRGLATSITDVQIRVLLDNISSSSPTQKPVIELSTNTHNDNLLITQGI